MNNNINEKDANQVEEQKTAKELAVKLYEAAYMFEKPIKPRRPSDPNFGVSSVVFVALTIIFGIAMIWSIIDFIRYMNASYFEKISLDPIADNIWDVLTFVGAFLVCLFMSSVCISGNIESEKRFSKEVPYYNEWTKRYEEELSIYEKKVEDGQRAKKELKKLFLRVDESSNSINLEDL